MASTATAPVSEDLLNKLIYDATIEAGYGLDETLLSSVQYREGIVEALVELRALRNARKRGELALTYYAEGRIWDNGENAREALMP